MKAPGNEMFILCCTAYEIFCKIKHSSKFDSFLRLRSPRNVFCIYTALHHMKENNICCVSCRADHNLCDVFYKSIFIFFNVLARIFLRVPFQDHKPTVVIEKFKNYVQPSDKPFVEIVLLYFVAFNQCFLLHVLQYYTLSIAFMWFKRIKLCA